MNPGPADLECVCIPISVVERQDLSADSPVGTSLARLILGVRPRGGPRSQLWQPWRACRATSPVRNIAEGAGRWSGPDKAARFTVARGEAAEASACVDILAVSGLVDGQRAAAVVDDLDRVGGMLTRLIRRSRGG